MDSLERLYLELRHEEESYFDDLTQDVISKVLSVLQPYVNNKNAL